MSRCENIQGKSEVLNEKKKQFLREKNVRQMKLTKVI